MIKQTVTYSFVAFAKGKNNLGLSNQWYFFNIVREVFFLTSH